MPVQKQAIETQIGRFSNVSSVGRVDSSLKTQSLINGLSQLSASMNAFTSSIGIPVLAEIVAAPAP